MRLIQVEWDHPDAVALRDAMVAEVAVLYSSDRSLAPRDGNSDLDPATILVTGLVYEGETPIAHVALRRLGEDLEIKRMFVAPECRGLGRSKHLLEEMERVAREEGASRIILHTGNQQVAAIALYEANGYTPIPVYEPYVDLPDFATIGAGPLLLVTTASLAQLNDWIEGDAEPMVIERFRPNVVIDGVDEPFAEDRWRQIRIGNVGYRFAEYCDRCVVTTIDPHTLEHGKEPIRTLARYRKWDGKTWFGIRIIPLSVGRLAVGDTVCE